MSITCFKEIICPDELTEENKFVADPKNCTRYYVCQIEGDPVHECCPQESPHEHAEDISLFWNDKANTCDWPWNVDCESTKIIMTSEHKFHFK